MIVLEDGTLTTLREFVQIINEFTNYHKKASYDISNPKLYRPSTYSEPSKQYEEIVTKIYPNLVKLLREEPAKLLLPLAYNWCDTKLHNLKTETNLWHASTVGMVMRNVKKHYG